MKHENTRRLYDYWSRLRGERPAPYRSELDPRAIAPLLESTFILEHSERVAPRFRLAGTKLCDTFGMELRGMSALSLWHGEGRAQIRDLLAAVVGARPAGTRQADDPAVSPPARPGVGHATCTVETRDGQLVAAEFLFLPLYNDLGVLNRILGCGYYLGGAMLDGARTSARGAPLGGAPAHHWVDGVALYPIRGAGDPLLGRPLTAGAVGERARATGSGRRGELDGAAGRDRRAPRPDLGRSIARAESEALDFGLDAEPARGGSVTTLGEGRRRRTGGRPALYAIDGGAPNRTAIERLSAERAAAPATERAEGRLRLIHGEKQD